MSIEPFDKVTETAVTLMAHANRVHAERPALETVDGSVTYRELFSDVVATASKLEAIDADRVAVWCKRLRSQVCAMYAGMLTGAIVFLVPRDMPSETQCALRSAYGISCFLTDRKDAGAWGDSIPVEAPCISEGVLPAADALVQAIEDRGRNLSVDDIALALFTSGTTGLPRAVPVTHRNLVWTTHVFNEFMGISEPMHELVLPPLAHSFGARRLLAQLAVGGCVHASEDQVLNPAWAANVIQKYSCATVSAVPSHIRLLVSLFGQKLKTIGASIRHMELSSEPMDAEEKQALMDLLPNADIVMGYGLTEATRTVLLRFREDHEKLAKAGAPFPGVKVDILDDDGAPVDDDESGEIYVSGPNVFPGYLTRDGVDRSPVEKGHYATGDVGFIDKDGFLQIVGRADAVINVGGRKVHPVELEALIRRRFRDTVFAISYLKDDLVGAIPVLCIEGDSAEGNEMLALIRENCESYKWPKEVIHLNEIPRTANGKIKRTDLRDVLDRVERSV